MRLRHLWARFALIIAFAVSANLEDQERDFQRALSLSKAGMETQAIQSWIDYLRRYPQGSKTDQAYFQLAQVYFSRGQFLEARTEVLRVFRFPSSDKAPEAAVLVGETFLKEKKLKEARIYWESVLRKYPKTKAAEKAKNLLLALGDKKS